MKRKQVIIRTSIGGVLANVLLGIFKIVVGVLAGSFAVIADAVGNFTDALSSVVIIVGTIYSHKSADRKHPFGYGRFEYMVTLIISMIVLYAGAEAMIETFHLIHSPQNVHYTDLTIMIIIVSILVKIVYGQYTKIRAEEVHSASLHASGSEAVHHALISLFTLLAAVINLLTGIRLDPLASGIVGIFIIYEGIHLLRDTLSNIMGEKVSSDIMHQIKDTIHSIDGVLGAYDLLLHDYGPDRLVGSVHIEVPDTLTADQIDKLERQIAAKVLKEHQVLLSGIGIYSHHTKDKQICYLRDAITQQILSYDHVAGVHGFYLNAAAKEISLDVVISFDEKDKFQLFQKIQKDIQEKYPVYRFHMMMDLEI